MADQTYHNFDLSFLPDGDAYRVKVDSPEGQATHTFELPFSDMELENFLYKTRPGSRSVRRIDTPDMEAAKKFGGSLFNAVFDGEVLGIWRSSINAATRDDTRLRVRLRFTDTPELADLPWEYLYSASFNRFLAHSDQSAIVRFLDKSEPTRPVTVKLPLHVLVVISNPSKLAELDVDREWANIQGALSPLQEKGLVHLDLLSDATLSNIRKQLKVRQYHILHFIGHGEFDMKTQQGVVILLDKEGSASRVSAQDLGRHLHNHRSLALAIINACEGARADRKDAFSGTAQTLVQQGIPAVIAMQFEITDDAAKTFSQALYTAIAENDPVEHALFEARMSMLAEEHGLEWATPTLYMQAINGALFDITDVPQTNTDNSPLVKPGEDEDKKLPKKDENDQLKDDSDETLVLEDEQKRNISKEEEVTPRKVPVGNRLVWTYDRKDRLAFTRTTHELTISPDGVHLACCNGSRSIVVLDMSTGKVVRTLEGRNSFVKVFFSPDGATLAALSGGNVFFWSMSDGTSLGTVNAQLDNSPIKSIAFSPDWTFIATGLSNGTIAIRKRDDGTLLRSINNTLGVARGLAFSADGKTLAARSKSGIALFYVASGSHIKDLLKTEQPMYTPEIALSPDGRYLAFTEGVTTQLLNVSEDAAGIPRRNKIMVYHTGGQVARTFAFSPDGHLIASGGADNHVRIIPVPDTANETNPAYAGTAIRIESMSTPDSIAFSPDSRMLAAALINGTAQLWELGSGKSE